MIPGLNACVHEHLLNSSLLMEIKCRRVDPLRLFAALGHKTLKIIDDDMSIGALLSFFLSFCRLI